MAGTKSQIAVLFIAAAIIAAGAGQAVSASTLTWDSSGSSPTHPADGTGNWDTTTNNWSNGSVDSGWVNGDTAIFGNGGTAGTVTIDQTGLSAGGLTFSPLAGGTRYTIAGDALTLTNGATITTSYSATITAGLTGTSGFTKAGPGTLTLGGGSADTIVGPININAGTLATENGASLSHTTGTITIASGATLNLDGGFDNTTVSNAITLGGTLNGGSNISINGPIILTGSSAEISHDYNNFNVNSTITGTGTNLTLYSWDSGQNAMDMNKEISLGSGAITVTGANGTQFGSANIYTGGTNIESGRLVATVDGSLGTGNVTIAAGAILSLSSGSFTNGAMSQQASLDLLSSSGNYGVVAFGTSTFDQIVGALDINGIAQAPGTYTDVNLSNYITGDGSITVDAIPLPSSMALAGIGMLGLLLWKWRSKRNTGKSMINCITTKSIAFRGKVKSVGRLVIAVVLLTVVFASQFALAQAASVRTSQDDVASPNIRYIRLIDNHWLLHRMPGFHHWKSVAVLNAPEIAQLQCPWPTDDWSPVQLPNDYLISGTVSHKANSQHGFLPAYPAWYRRTFTLPATACGKTVWLNFGGVYRDAVIFINGQMVGQHPGGYVGFRYDISKFAHFGASNTLAVFVDPRWLEGWWYEGGGIYRHVRLIITDKLHVAPWGTFVISKVPGTIDYSSSNGDHADANLTIQTTVDNAHHTDRPFTLISRIIGPDGKELATISSPEHLAAGQKATITQHAAISNAALWSLHHCNLYHLVTSLQVDHVIVDCKRTTFGIRTIRFNPNRGFFLNGRHVEIKGTCNHQDFPGIGNGVPDNLWYWRIAKLKAMGSNAYRTFHGPMATAFYSACNHLGMLVMDENRHLGDAWTPKSYHGTSYSNLTDLRDMILQQRHDPCIIFWSMCNEEWPLQGKPEGAKIFAAMKAAVDDLDPTRPVTSAMNGGYNKHGFFSVEDLLGINYHCQNYPGIHRKYPAKMIFGSEDFNCFSVRGILHTSRQSGLCSEFGPQLPHIGGFLQGHTPWRSWIPVVEHSYIAGDFIWVGFDYHGEPSPFYWPATTSQNGTMDQCGFPKPCYYYWRAWWGTTPSVYIFPAWTFPKSMLGQPIHIRCYSNCNRVELFLNGKSLGIKPMPKYKYVDWTVPYTPGTLTARGYDANHVAATYSCQTAGLAAALQLTEEVSSLAANGESIAPIAVKVVDALGNLVPDADNLVRFTISGDGSIAGVGNGNPANHESNTAHQIQAFNGTCVVMVRSGHNAGVLHVAATAQGLKAKVMNIVVSQ